MYGVENTLYIEGTLPTTILDKLFDNDNRKLSVEHISLIREAIYLLFIRKVTQK